jgi:hypothetical protein
LLPHTCNALRPSLTGFELWHDLIAQEPRQQVSQLGDGLVMHAPIRRHVHHPYRSEIAKTFKALACRTPAEPQPVDQLIHRQRVSREKEQPIDFGEGPGLAQRSGDLHEQINNLDVERIEGGYFGVAFPGGIPSARANIGHPYTKKVYFVQSEMDEMKPARDGPDSTRQIRRRPKAPAQSELTSRASVGPGTRSRSLMQLSETP